MKKKSKKLVVTKIISQNTASFDITYRVISQRLQKDWTDEEVTVGVTPPNKAYDVINCLYLDSKTDGFDKSYIVEYLGSHPKEDILSYVREHLKNKIAA